MRLFALCAALVLTGCAGIQPGPTWWAVRKDEAIEHPVRRIPVLLLADRQLQCLRADGIFTSDKQACMAQGKVLCYYYTAPGDLGHDPELNAYCNGYRPDHY